MSDTVTNTITLKAADRIVTHTDNPPREIDMSIATIKAAINMAVSFKKWVVLMVQTLLQNLYKFLVDLYLLHFQ